MVKKRKIKKSVLVAISIVAFFIIYGLAFYAGTYLDNKDKPKVESKEDEEIDNRPLMKQLSSKKKIYMSNEEVENIKVDEIYWDEVKYELTKFSKVRKSSDMWSRHTSIPCRARCGWNAMTSFFPVRFRAWFTAAARSRMKICRICACTIRSL